VRDFGGHQVAGLVAVGVVDRLEAVDVDADERELAAMADAERDLACKLVRSLATVRQPRQVVRQRAARAAGWPPAARRGAA
jgi:hypothetical protein